jgi:hypothetical protein
MEKVLRVTNVLLGIIALCLLLLVASVYRVDMVSIAQAQTGSGPQPVYLVYWPPNSTPLPVIGPDGRLPTKR